MVATAEEIGGHYCSDCQVATVVPDDKAILPHTVGVKAYAVDRVRAEALWAKSEEMVNEKF